MLVANRTTSGSFPGAFRARRASENQRSAARRRYPTGMTRATARKGPAPTITTSTLLRLMRSSQNSVEQTDTGPVGPAKYWVQQTLLQFIERWQRIGKVETVERARAPDEVAEKRADGLAERRRVDSIRRGEDILQVPHVSGQPARSPADVVVRDLLEPFPGCPV
jgi:hypothetical protein